jgi:2-polyprenyl-6-methoxyphenol hydroxylase-like FAD-dependent oxidoreductase
MSKLRIVIVGAGPTGLYAAVALARRGHGVVVVDRDRGPAPDGRWDRIGVMQFDSPHVFRPQVLEALADEMSETLDALVTAGAKIVPVPDQPELGAVMRCRRVTFERVLRAAANLEPGVKLIHGHADHVIDEHGRAAGLLVDGCRFEANLVLDATGRSGRLSPGRRAKAQRADCGITYTSRLHRLRPGAGPGPLSMPTAAAELHHGYQVMAIPHDNDVFSTLIIRASNDRALARLHDVDAYDAAVTAIPLLAKWTEPARGYPISGVISSGRLRNEYRGQLDDHGAVALPGLLFVGDAVCTTNPTAGRGIATSLMQVQKLLALLDQDASDVSSIVSTFDVWCEEAVKPWFEDHVERDAGLTARWAGAAIDLGRRLPSDLIVAAAGADPSLMDVVRPYVAMRRLPASLDDIEPQARKIFSDGWRPPVSVGPTHDELAALLARRG